MVGANQEPFGHPDASSRHRRLATADSPQRPADRKNRWFPAPEHMSGRSGRPTRYEKAPKERRMIPLVLAHVFSQFQTGLATTGASRFCGR